MHKYGDHVVYVKKTPDGDLLLNATVLASTMHVPLRGDRMPHRTLEGELIPMEEHLDLAFPVPTTTGEAPKSRALDEIFRPANDVRQDTGQGGWRLYDARVDVAIDNLDQVVQKLCGNIERAAAKDGMTLAELNAKAGEYLSKSSGDDQNAGAWTEAGDGMGYPVVANSGLPSQADLDAAAAEEAAKNATKEPE